MDKDQQLKRLDTIKAEGEIQVEEKKKRGRPPKKRIPLWDRREQELRDNGTTPRNFFEQDWTVVKTNPGIKKHVRFLWMSDIIREKRPMLPGFMPEIYQPVTPDLIEEWGLVLNTPDRTADGVPRAGMDASLHWAPENVAKEQDDVMAGGANMAKKMAQARAELKEKVGEDMIGSIETADNLADLASKEVKQREELGTPL